MPILLSIVLVFASMVLLVRVYSFFSEKLQFFSRGFDFGFKMREISALWKLSKKCHLAEPLSLYYSENSVNKCIASVIESAKKSGEENSFRVQNFLERLYKFKTRVVLEVDSRRGLDGTQSLAVGQRLSVILKGKGVFTSKVLNNGTQLTILLPHRISPLTGRSESLAPGEWKDREISVYFWRKGDAGYAFDSKVLGSGFYRSDNALFLMHSRKLDRTQKRQSIRCKCEIYGKMFFTDGKPESSYRIESSVGYKCLIEDISEDGALIRIGGKCKSGTAIKIQFEINGSLVVMHGVIRAVEWNKTMNQSRLHFECMKIDRGMKNTVLTFVYNVLPPEEKQIHEAIAQAESAEREAAQVVIHKEEFEEF